MVRARPERRIEHDEPGIPHREPASGTGSLEAAIPAEPNRIRRFLENVVGWVAAGIMFLAAGVLLLTSI
jgi:hypothetical protein